MTEAPAPAEPGKDPIEINTDVARPARVQNYLAGGDDNFAADREAATYAATDYPGGMDAARATVSSLAGFMVRAVRYLAGERGVRQFLHTGTPIPTAEDVHVVAQRVAPESRIVYVGDDPVVLAHAHSLRKSSPTGAAAYVHSTLRRPDELLEQAAATLDLDRPIAVMLLATLGFIPDEYDPHGILGQLLASLAPGSYVVLAHTANDIHEGVAEAAERLSKVLGRRYVVRSHPDILRFLRGLDLVDPGLVQIDQWRPDPNQPPPPATEHPVPIYAAVASKP